jgi:hypothetical protein
VHINIKYIHRFFGIILKLFVALLFAIVILYAAIQTSYVQTHLTRYVAQRFSNDYNIDIRIGKVDLGLWSYIILEDVDIIENNTDTIIAMQQLWGRIEIVEIADLKFSFSELKLISPQLHIQIDENGNTNLSELSKLFNLENSNTKNITLDFSNIFVENGIFSLYNESNDKSNNQLFNSNNIYVKDASFEIFDLSYSDNGLMLQLKNLSFEEKSGIKVKKLSTQVFFNSQNLSFNNIELVSNNSFIYVNYLNFIYESFESFDEFVNNVTIRTDIAESILSLEDIVFFTNKVEGLHSEFIVRGRIEGLVSDFKAKDLRVLYNKTSFFWGDADVVGLPDILNAYLHLDVKKLKTTSGDIQAILTKQTTGECIFKIPEIVKKIQLIEYDGVFSGYSTNFVTYGNFITPIGKFSTDLSLKTDSLFFDYIAKGRLKIDTLHLNTYLNNKDLGVIAGDFNIDGLFDTEGKIEAIVKSTVQSFDYKQYTYNNIVMDGKINSKKYNGLLSINDKNLKANFDGLFDFKDSIPVYDFTLNIEKANLYNLNFIKDDSLLNLKTNIVANFSGKSINDIQGSIKFKNTVLKNKHSSFSQDSILISIINSHPVSSINISSNALDFNCKGEFLLKNAFHDFGVFGSRFFPTLFSEYKDKKIITGNFQFDFNLKELDTIFQLIVPELSIANNSFGAGSFNSIGNKFNVIFMSNKISYSLAEIQNLELNVTSKDEFMQIDMLYDLPFDKKTITSINTFWKIADNKIDFNTNWENIDSLTYKGDITGKFLIENNSINKPVISASFDSGTIIIADSVWENKNFGIVVDSTAIAIKDFQFFSNKQRIKIDGNISEQKSDSLFLNINGFDMHNANKYVRAEKFEIHGELGGLIKITNVYDEMLMHFELLGKQVSLNDVKLGNLHLYSRWKPESKQLQIFTEIEKYGKKSLVAGGYYVPATKDIYIQSRLENLEVSFLQRIIKSIFSDVEGFLDGKIEIVGNISNPKIIGQGYLHDAKMKVRYSNVNYFLNGNVKFENNILTFSNIELKDKFNNIGNVNGDLNLTKILYPEYDFDISIEKTLILDTKEIDNELFYGSVFASGIVKVFGDMNQTDIEAAASSENNSVLYIPYSESNFLSENGFVRFVQHDNLSIIDEVEEIVADIKKHDIEFEFDFDVNPNLEVNLLVYDYAYGNISARGNGLMKLNVNRFEEFTMSGEYEILSGNYRFMFGNMINKKFNIREGSTILWNGDPYNVNLNIEAVYNLKASLKPIMYMYDTTDVAVNMRVPVDCQLFMRNTLYNPDIRFGIDLLDIDEKPKEILESLDEDEKNRQFFSLLVLNSFLPLSSSGTVSATNSNPINVSSWEVVSNQVSGLLSQVSNDFDLGINFRPGDEITSDEFEVGVSTQILNDRVIVSALGVTEFSKSGTELEQTNSSKFAGDVTVEVKLNKRGNIRLKAFSRSDNDPYRHTDETTQGIGIFYAEDFNYLSDLRKRNRDKKKQSSSENNLQKNDAILPKDSLDINNK